MRGQPLRARLHWLVASGLIGVTGAAFINWLQAGHVSILIIEGDSQSTGFFNDFPRNLVAAIPSELSVTNLAVGGERLSQMLDDFDLEILPKFDASAASCVLHLFAGTNDFGLDHASADEVLDRLRRLALKGKAGGFLVIVTTLPLRDWRGNGEFPADRPDINARIGVFNTRLRVEYPKFADRLVDYASHETLGDPTKATIDGVHLSRGAAKEAAELSAATFNELRLAEIQRKGTATTAATSVPKAR